MRRAVQDALSSILSSADWTPSRNDLVIRDNPAGVFGDLPVSDMAAAGYGALALAAADLHQARDGPRLTPFVDRRHAGIALTGNDYVRIDGETPDKWGAITGYFRCRDGAFVYLHGQFPHLRDGLLNLFGVEEDRVKMAEAVAKWSSDDAEAQGQARGLCVIKVRDRTEWETHDQFAALSQKPLVDLSLQGATKALPPAGALPLSGIRVLDLSRVIAGPMAGRALAELGADVIRISGPDLPNLEPLVIDTGFGKRAAFADIRTDEGRAALSRLIQDADILIDGFRPGALAAKGFSTENMISANPSLTIIDLSAFSNVGPWAGRRGYDSYVQAGMGLTSPLIKGEAPGRLSTQPLDYLAGALCAFGGVLSLLSRAAAGPRHVEMSLARTGMWVWEMADALPAEPSPPTENASFEALKADGLIRKMSSDFGQVEALAAPYGFDGGIVEWSGPPHRLGSSAPVWL